MMNSDLATVGASIAGHLDKSFWQSATVAVATYPTSRRRSGNARKSIFIFAGSNKSKDCFWGKSGLRRTGTCC